MFWLAFSCFVAISLVISSCDSTSFLNICSSTFMDMPLHGFLNITSCSMAQLITFLNRAQIVFAPSPTLLLCKYMVKSSIISFVICSGFIALENFSYSGVSCRKSLKRCKAILTILKSFFVQPSIQFWKQSKKLMFLFVLRRYPKLPSFNCCSLSNLIFWAKAIISLLLCRSNGVRGFASNVRCRNSLFLCTLLVCSPVYSSTSLTRPK